MPALDCCGTDEVEEEEEVEEVVVVVVVNESRNSLSLFFSMASA